MAGSAGSKLKDGNTDLDIAEHRMRWGGASGGGEGQVERGELSRGRKERAEVGRNERR